MSDAAAAIVESVEFTCTETDFLDAQRLHHTLSLRGRRFLIVLAVGVVVISAIFLFDETDRGLASLLSGLTAAAAYLGFMAIMILIARWVILPMSARRLLKQLKEFRGPIKFAVSPPRIVIDTTRGHVEMPAEDFLKWAENGKSILLYRSDRQFNFVPKRVISEQFHRSLVAELTKAGVAKAGFSNS